MAKGKKGIGRSTGNFPVPSFIEERLFEAQGYFYIAGIDEVGRGSLAGPVVAAAVILPSGLDASWLNLVRDSKLLNSARRESLSHHIHEAAVTIGIGSADCATIDTQGIIKATQLAMTLAIRRLSPPAEALLIDFMLLPGIQLPQKGIVDGDSLCLSIACASIIAKVSRDHLMSALDNVYPGYGLAKHKGYGTSQHLACLSRQGPSPIHRRSFGPVKDLIE
jgi:ribonuclease HII